MISNVGYILFTHTMILVIIMTLQLLHHERSLETAVPGEDFEMNASQLGNL